MRKGKVIGAGKSICAIVRLTIQVWYGLKCDIGRFSSWWPSRKMVGWMSLRVISCRASDEI
jgi:hypothetical protein